MQPDDAKTLIEAAGDLTETYLGYHESTLGVEENVALPDRHRFTHILSLGQTGTGKTQHMVHAALQDAHKDHGFCMIIPKGRTIDEVIEKLPDDRLDDIIYINPNREPVTPINVLEPHTTADMTAAEKNTHKELIVSNVVDLFRRQSINWGDQFGHVFETLLRAHVDLNLYHDEQNTLTDVYQCVVSDDALVDLIDRTQDEIIRNQLVTIKEDMSSYEMKPLQNRINDFVMNDPVRKVIAAEESGINFRTAVNEGKIILVDIRAGQLGNTVTTLIGSIVVTKVWAAAQSRIAMPAEERTPFYLYVDEVHRFGGEGSVFTEILSTAREYKLGCWLVTQYLGQLEPNMREEVASNCRSKVVFDPSGSEDITQLGRLLQGISKSDLTQLVDYKAVVQRRKRQESAVSVIVDTYPPWEVEDGNDVEMVKQQQTFATNSQPTTAVRQSLGQTANAGGERHQELLAAAKEHLEAQEGAQVNLLYQDHGDEKPDGQIITDNGVIKHLEAEVSTLSRPVKVLRNVQRAAEQGRDILFVVEQDRAKKLENIVRDPVNRRGSEQEDDDGTYTYYSDEKGDPFTAVNVVDEVDYRILETRANTVVPVDEERTAECPELDDNDPDALQAFCLHREADGHCSALGQECVLDYES
jgi:hypothetical protein